MKVDELIEILKELDPNMEIIIDSNDGGVTSDIMVAVLTNSCDDPTPVAYGIVDANSEGKIH